MNLYQIAKTLRRNATKAEKLMWKYLSNRQLNNLKFRSQAVVELMYIADFYCASKKLIIEIDGSIHDNEEQQADVVNSRHQLPLLTSIL